MKVRFLRPYDYTPSGDRRITLAYPADWEGTVKRECGEAAVAAGAAEELADFNGADPAAFDHDGDGHPGGTLARRGPRRAGRKADA